MALWSNDKGEQFDDGLAFEPGEEGFTRDIAAAHFGDASFNYLGTPNRALRIEAEHQAALAAEREAAAKARIAELIDPAGCARARIEAEHEALAAFATGEEAAQLEAVKEARLAALEPTEPADA